ncbi:hypothetical protein BBJ28_00006002 [Nothophytophthora sp. Chile5]|nr:hypothetical protein BBJ28_00006002 [Nothophytophthora sp. Chile5]
MAAEGDWSFMRPWCQHLHDRLYYAGESPLTSPDEILYYLAVGLPTIRPWSDDLETIMDSTRKLREAVALLTAVAHVDHATWKRLLLDDCHMDVGTEEDVFMGDIPPRFQLTLDCDGPDSGDVIPHGLLAFCGTEQHANHTEEYSEALAKIATLSHDSGSAAATEIEIPITVEISPWLTESSEGTFMYAQTRQTVGELLTGLFGGSRRSDAAARAGWGNLEATALTGPLAAIYGHSDQLSVDSLHLVCKGMQNWVFERVCSALAVNQTTTNLALELEYHSDDGDEYYRTPSRWRWICQWIAYAFFSERARLSSRLESLSLYNVYIAAEAVEAIAAVLASDDPEGELLGWTALRHGLSTDVSILANASIRLESMNLDEELDSINPFSVGRELNGVRLLDDNEGNGWVDVLVPGFGRCQTQRTSLRRRDDTLPVNGLAGVTALAISFVEVMDPEVLDGLFALIGASLTSLTLNCVSLATWQLAGIVTSCPNLVELAVRTHTLETRFSLRDSKCRGLKLPSTSHCDFDDIEEITEVLSDAENPLAKCIRRLRIRMDLQPLSYPEEDYYRALLNMLRVNRTLEYLDLVVPRPHMLYFDAFQAHHLELLPVVQAKFPLESKLAFLSVMAPNCHEGGAVRELDEPLVASIFEYAATCVKRRVKFREEDLQWTRRQHAPI